MTPRVRLAIVGIGLAVVMLGLRYFVWWDVGARCFIGIRPSLVGFDNRTIKRALATLEHGSPEDYRKVCAHVATINPNPSCGGFRASVDVSTEHGLIWTIAIIVHETCHAIQYHEGRPAQFNLEQECYAEDDRILRTLVQFE